MIDVQLNGGRKQRRRICLAIAIAAAALALRTPTMAQADDAPLLLLASAPPPATTASVVPTPSQAGNTQLNQLFQFEATPNICAAGEGYLSGQFSRISEYSEAYSYRYELQGQYGITDQIAVGAGLPYLYNAAIHNHITAKGFGDVVLYGQYKFDQVIAPKLFSLTGQVGVVLPTGREYELRDTGNFGVRPLLIGYKDFGEVGPGRLGAYGELGLTLSSDSDVRWGLAAAYELNHWAGVLELTGEDGSDFYGNMALFTPGLIYRGFNRLELALGVPLGLTNDSPDWGVQAKITYSFAK